MITENDARTILALLQRVETIRFDESTPAAEIRAKLIEIANFPPATVGKTNPETTEKVENPEGKAG